jgi:hypothetical protein
MFLTILPFQISRYPFVAAKTSLSMAEMLVNLVTLARGPSFVPAGQGFRCHQKRRRRLQRMGKEGVMATRGTGYLVAAPCRVHLH